MVAQTHYNRYLVARILKPLYCFGLPPKLHSVIRYDCEHYRVMSKILKLHINDHS